MRPIVSSLCCARFKMEHLSPMSNLFLEISSKFPFYLLLAARELSYTVPTFAPFLLPGLLKKFCFNSQRHTNVCGIALSRRGHV
jgi:hypothetical protein